MIYFLLGVAGLVGGFLAGLTGIGTGFLMIVIIPIALHHMGIPDEELVKLTIANTVFATMCSAFVNNLTLLIKKQLYIKETLQVSLTAVISAAVTLQFFVLHATYSKDTYNSVIIVFLAYIIYRTINKLRKPLHNEEKSSNLKLYVTGGSGGVVSAVTGLGGGSVIIPILNLWAKMDIRKAKSISFGTIFSISLMLTVLNLFNSPAEPLSHAHIGYILLPVALPLSAGVILASPLGTSLSDHLSSRMATIIFLAIISMVLLRKTFELWA